MKFLRVVIILLALSPAAAKADGEFLQFDRSRDNSTAVATFARGRMLFDFVRSDYRGGSDLNFAITRQFPLRIGGHDASLHFGPAVRLQQNGTFRVGTKLSMDSYNTTSWGSLYLLGEVNSIGFGVFGLAQFGFKDTQWGFELSHFSDAENYHENAVTTTYRVPNSRLSLRLGHKFGPDQTFVGVAFNTF